jgi:hypothetical protein
VLAMFQAATIARAQSGNHTAVAVGGIAIAAKPKASPSQPG